MTPEERRAFVQETNVGATQRMSATEQAQVDASNITHDHLATPGPEQGTDVGGEPGLREQMGKHAAPDRAQRGPGRGRVSLG